VGSYVLLGAEFSRLVECDESRLELNSEDPFRGSEIVVVDIRHVRDKFVCEGCASSGRGDGE